MKFEYLIFNIIIFLSSTLSVILSKKGKLPYLKYFLYTFIIIGIPFVYWDYLVTNSWWSFNQNFVLGYNLFNLPIEEIMFFFTVPWACLTLWINIEDHEKVSKSGLDLIIPSLIFLIGLIICLTGKVYAGTTLIVFSLVSLISLASGFWFRKIKFRVFLLIVVCLTFIFNTYLTARLVVIYNPHYLTGFMVGTIPIEDFIFGLGLITGFVGVYEYFLIKYSNE